MTRHAAVTIAAPVQRGSDLQALAAKLDALGHILDEVTGAPGPAASTEPASIPPTVESQLSALLKQERIHFMSFFLTERLRDEAPAYVVLEINWDGAPRSCHVELIRSAPALLEELFSECEQFGEMAGQGRLKTFLFKHEIGAGAFYIGCPGRSVRQITRERSQRQELRKQFDSRPWAVTARDTWSGLQAAIGRAPVPPPRRPFWVRWGLHPRGARQRLSGLRSLLLGPLFAAVAGIGLWRLIVDQPREPIVRASLVIGVPLVLAAILVGAIWRNEKPARANLAAQLRLVAPYARDSSAVALLLLVLVGLVPGLAWLAEQPVVIAALQDWVAPLAITAAGALALTVALLLVYVLSGRLVTTLLGALMLGGWAATVHAYWSSPLRLAQYGALATAVVALAIAIAAIVFLVAVRRHELAEPDESSLDWDLEHIERTTSREDRQLQNHLATVSEIKPGRFRLYALAVVLRGIALAAKLYFNRGELAGISSIHFARFVILPDRRRLLFCGNYDGGFAAYLGAFHSVAGTSAVWSNTRRFPRAFLLVGDGSHEEQRFKAFGRRDQVPTLGWYSAYPNLSVQAIDAATESAEALQRAVLKDSRAAGAIARALGRGGLDEAQCDAVLRKL